MWDLKEMQTQMVEKHLETTKISDLQKDALSDFLCLWEMSEAVEKWIGKTETKASTCDDQYKAIFVGTHVEQWQKLTKVGQKLRKNPLIHSTLLGEKEKCQIGLNILHLIVNTIREINDKAMFFDNIKSVDELLCAGSKAFRIWSKLIESVLNKHGGSDQNGVDYLANSGILFSSLTLSYRKNIAHEMENGIRKTLDLFF